MPLKMKKFWKFLTTSRKGMSLVALKMLAKEGKSWLRMKARPRRRIWAPK